MVDGLHREFQTLVKLSNANVVVVRPFSVCHISTLATRSRFHIFNLLL